jgi:hypothetical protein
VWVIGRVAYSVEYMADPANRGAGLMIQLVASAVLLFEALGRIVVSVVYGPFRNATPPALPPPFWRVTPIGAWVSADFSRWRDRFCSRSAQETRGMANAPRRSYRA